MKYYHLSPFLLFLSLFNSLSQASDIDESSPVDVSTIITDSVENISRVDTLLFAPPDPITSAAKVTNPVDFEKHLKQQPTVALFKSMFVPGLGQLGNHHYTKAVFVIGLQSWFVVSAIHYGRQTNDAREKLDKAGSASERIDLFNFYDNKRKNRNKFIWFAGITTFISMFDAYVDAHLSGSPTNKHNEMFSFDLTPTPLGGVSASLSYNF